MCFQTGTQPLLLRSSSVFFPPRSFCWFCLASSACVCSMRRHGRPAGARSSLFLLRVNLSHPLCMAPTRSSSAASPPLDGEIQSLHTLLWFRRDLHICNGANANRMRRNRAAVEGRLPHYQEEKKHLCNPAQVSVDSKGIKLGCDGNFPTLRTSTRPELPEIIPGSTFFPSAPVESGSIRPWTGRMDGF